MPCQYSISLRPIWPKSAERTHAAHFVRRPMDPTTDTPFLPDFWQSVRLIVLEFVAVAILGGLLLLDLPVGFGSVLAKLSILWLGWRWTKRTWRETVPIGPIRLAFSAVLPPFPEWASRAIVGSGFLDLVVLVPIVEGALFGGLVLGGYVRTYRPAKAIHLCGFVFAISHVLPWPFQAAFIGGVYISWLTVETRSIVLPVSGHALTNERAWWMMRRPDIGAAYDPRPATLRIPGVILLVPGTWLLRLTLRRAPLRSLTMGVA
jgi:membrane protease YdiL (CAAX protease family)